MTVELKIPRNPVFLPGEPCRHPGCLSHVSHPCESCGRIAGFPPKGDLYEVWVEGIWGEETGPCLVRAESRSKAKYKVGLSWSDASGRPIGEFFKHCKAKKVTV